jgi:integrase
VDRLIPADIDAAVRAHGTWGQTTEHHARGRLVTALNWAVKNRVIASNPLAGLWRPPARSRGAEVVTSADDAAKLMAAAPEYLRNVLFALQQTGARPCEVVTVTAADFDPVAGVWILHDHKTAGKTGAPRVVFLPPEVVELCKTLAVRNSSGPLFRRQLGTPFPSACYLARLVRKLRRKLGLPETIIPYGFRHTFATDALAGGVPEAHVAELLGHKGTAMLHKHYAHLGTKAAVLRAALGRVRGAEK